MLQDRVDVFNAEATGRLHVPRYDGGFFVSVFTPDAQVTAAAMRELGVYIIPLDGAVRVALCSTPVTAVPPLVEALEAGVEAAQATD
jgi:aromatic-amino-acid transaminase